MAALRLAGVAADSINSGNGRAENVAAWQRAAAGKPRLLYMAPERLMTDRMLAALARLQVTLFAVDEAHCISQWGPAFRPEYADLCRLRELFPGIPAVALTATADEVTRDDIVDELFGGTVEQFVLGFDRPIRLAVEMKRDWKRQLTGFVSRHEGERRYRLLPVAPEDGGNGGAAGGRRRTRAALSRRHGGGGREAHQNAFMTEPGVVIVATIAFGMGIDKADVRYVFHTDLPGSVEAYYQEIGGPARRRPRRGAHALRARRHPDEAAVHRGRGCRAGTQRREHKRLDALLGYCEAPACRRTALLEYFGEGTEPCGNCDVCLSRRNGSTAPRRRGRSCRRPYSRASVSARRT